MLLLSCRSFNIPSSISDEEKYPMPRFKPIDWGMKLLPIDLSVPILPGTTSNRGSFQKDIFYAAQPRSESGLVEREQDIQGSRNALSAR
jgi:hypothetical protein